MIPAAVDIQIVPLNSALWPASRARWHWLHPRELARFDQLRCARRRQQWWAGRWWMKRRIMTKLSLTVAPREICIESRDERQLGVAPRAWVHDEGLPLTLSLSHGADHVAVAISDLPTNAAIGIDLVEPSQPQDRALATWFTRHELLTEGDEVAWKEAWAAKEAAFKTLTGQPFQPRRIVLRPLTADSWRWSYTASPGLQGEVTLQRHPRFTLAIAHRTDV